MSPFLESRFFEFSWIILALLSALFDTGVHLCSKLSIKTLNELAVSAMMTLIASVFCFCFLGFSGFWSSGAIESVDTHYIFFVIFIGAIATIGMVLFFPVVFLLGFLFAMMHLCQMKAVVTGYVPYVLSIKRLAILFSVILGALIFKEKNLKQRAMAALLMIVGVAIIAFYA